MMLQLALYQLGLENSMHVCALIQTLLTKADHVCLFYNFHNHTYKNISM